MSEPAEDYATMRLDEVEASDGDVAAAFGRQPSGPWRWIRRVILIVLILAALASAARLIFTRTIVVPDGSMYPTIEQNSSLLVWKSDTAQPGDLVLLEVGEAMFMRRVIAGPGQTVEQRREGLVVDGEPVEREAVGEHEYYHLNPMEEGATEQSGQMLICDEVQAQLNGATVSLCIGTGSERPHEAVEMADDELYVRCDNRAFCSLRAAREGPIPMSAVRGRVVFLMGRPDDGAFHKRWVGRFESVE